MAVATASARPSPRGVPDDLQPDRQTGRIQARRDAGDGQPRHREEEGRCDPVDVGLHGPATDRLRIVLLHRKRRDGHARSQKRVVPLEELEQLLPHPAAYVLGRSDLGRSQRQPGAKVGRDVRAEGVDPVQFGLEVGHEPMAAQDEKRVPRIREVHIRFVHLRATRPQ